MNTNKIIEMENTALEKQSINLTDTQEIFYWCDRFNCEQNVLVNAVSSIGNNAKMVDLFLELNKWKNK